MRLQLQYLRVLQKEPKLQYLMDVEEVEEHADAREQPDAAPLHLRELSPQLRSAPARAIEGADDQDVGHGLRVVQVDVGVHEEEGLPGLVAGVFHLEALEEGVAVLLHVDVVDHDGEDGGADGEAEGHDWVDELVEPEVGCRQVGHHVLVIEMGFDEPRYVVDYDHRVQI